MFQFKFKGGIEKPSPHVVEKFLMFFLVGGEEVSIYEMIKADLVQHDPTKVFDTLSAREKTKIASGQMARPELAFMTKHHYSSVHPFLKLMLFRSGFGVAKLRKTYYIKLEEQCLTGIKITTFTSKLDFFFEAPSARLLTPAEVVQHLATDSVSRSLLAKEELIPAMITNRILQITHRDIVNTANVRKLRLGRR